MPSPDGLHAVELHGDRLKNRTFLLGDDAGFVLYLPVEQNKRDRTLMPIKWFGASEFGRKYLEGNLVWVATGGPATKLDRSNQTGFIQYLDRAVRTFQAGEVSITQTFFLPNRQHSVVMTLEADRPVTFAVEPEFDMRYYQLFNTDFGGYGARVVNEDTLAVWNRIEGPPSAGVLQFYTLVRGLGADVSVGMLPQGERLRRKTYLKDEEREKLIQSVYAQTHEVAPDEAPIWDQYSTTIYAPARLTGASPLTLIYSFDDTEQGTSEALETVSPHLAEERREKETSTLSMLDRGELETGRAEVDTAYAQVLSRFDNCLVARDVTVHTGQYTMAHWSAIFAGNKYFLDAWKRDENISLSGLLVSNQYETVRAILDETWTHQDPRTGRLPQIIRVGQPLVYYSSDGTLWALRRLYQYTHMSGDTGLLDQKYGMVERFFQASLHFVKRGLLPSGGIIDKAYLWETWEDTPFTPRNGYPVEIELLWLTALADYLPTVKARNPALAQRLEAALAEGRETFTHFYLDGYLADSLSYDWKPQPILTPNGYIAFDLHYPLPDALKAGMVSLAREQLAGHTGVKSLARRDWPAVLTEEFVGGRGNIERGHMASVGLYNYHRGVEWLWLNPYLLGGELQCGDTDKGYWEYVSGQVHSALNEMGVGGLSELYDTRGPLGADFQAWSMAGFIMSLHEFAGVEVDALARTVRVRPSIPHSWPRLRCKRRVGDTMFEVCYQADEHGGQIVEVQAPHGVPDGYTLELGVRTAPGQQSLRVSLDGESVPESEVRRESGCSAGAAGEAWVRTHLSSKVRAGFRL